ncbi:hypothetical protein M758_5G187000 [Ceratodon purpureus]|nr:hypothetical protein M758_5G187000 [Ceratodon purpureus]
MMAMAAVAGPQRMCCSGRADVVDGEKLSFGRRGGVTALRVGLVARSAGFGMNVSHAKAAPEWFRLAARSEDATAVGESVQEQPAVEAPAYEGPTVKVKFELQRECHFGQQFKVVGGDSQFGDWDPSAAVLLNWTEGHLWTAEVDVPEGKRFEYKYVLSGQEGEVEWQPGSNLVLEATAGAGSLVVSEPWEGAQPEPTAELEVQPAEPEVQHAEPELQPAEPVVQSAETDTRDWETVSDDAEASSPADALADAAASAAVGALNAGVKAAKALEGGLDAVSDSPNRETNGVAESKKEETPTAVEIPVVDAALAAAAAPTAPAAPATPAAPAAPAEEPATENGASATSQPETATIEKPEIKEQTKMEAQPRIKEQPIVEPKKRLNPFQKDIEWLSSLFGR